MVVVALTVVFVLVIIGIVIKFVRSIAKNGIKATLLKNIVYILIACVLLMTMGGYVIIGSNNVETKAWDYLENKGYQEDEIQSLEVTHSFLNIILSYDEWKIKVVYADEPTSTYSYRIVDDEIIEGGVSGTTDKEALKH